MNTYMYKYISLKMGPRSCTALSQNTFIFRYYRETNMYIYMYIFVCAVRGACVTSSMAVITAGTQHHEEDDEHRSIAAPLLPDLSYLTIVV